MKITHSIHYHTDTPTVVALGCFDGVHLGHAAVIRAAKEQADRLGIATAVFTFTEPPKNFFSPHSVPLITPPAQKEALISRIGADLLLSIPFDKEIATLSAEDFLRLVLRDRLRAAHIVCGFNYSFGARGAGNVALLESFCREKGIGLTVMPPIEADGQTVSSSLIRQAVMEGDLPTVRRLLGRNYSLCARVIDGQKLARRLGFPTLNQEIPEGVAVPRYGVYATRIHGVDSPAPLHGITNVGMRPTVKGTLLCSETHIFDFDGDLYGKELTVEFLAFLRPEAAFSSIDKLQEQVNADIVTARAYLSSL